MTQSLSGKSRELGIWFTSLGDMNSWRILSIRPLLRIERLIDKPYLTESININKKALIRNFQSLIGQIRKPSSQDREEIDIILATKTLDSI